jgi:signal transduction histidine kinase
MERELRQLAGDTVSLEIDLPSQPLIASGDRAALVHGIRSIVANAWEAMRSRGRILLSVERVVLSSPLAHPHGEVPAGTWAVVRCVDSGPGIADDAMARVFEPSLTSKHDHVETGLGLPITLARVEQMGGHVSVANVRDGGAEVRIWLPLAATTSTPRSRAHSAGRR